MVSRLIGFGAAPSGWPALTVAGRALAGLVDPTAWHDAEPIGVKPDGEDDPLAELVGDFRGSNYAGWLDVHPMQGRVCDAKAHIEVAV